VLDRALAPSAKPNPAVEPSKPLHESESGWPVKEPRPEAAWTAPDWTDYDFSQGDPVEVERPSPSSSVAGWTTIEKILGRPALKTYVAPDLHELIRAWRSG
jgi:hypothetical protein